MQLKHKNIRPQYDAAFAKDIRDFFSGRRSGHIGTWRYSEPLFKGDKVNGMYYWAEFVKNAKSGNSYYVVNDELEVIKALSGYIADLIKEEVAIVDLGPGSEEALYQKVCPFIKALDIKNYIGIDIVPECLERTRVSLNKYDTSISFDKTNADFYEDIIDLKSQTKNLMVMFGQTIFNLPIDPRIKNLPELVLQSRLSRFYKHLRGNGYLIVTQDCNQDPDSIYNAYMTEANFDLNLLYRIKRDLPVSDGFDPNGFYFEPKFFPDTGAASHTYIAKNNMQFELAEEVFFIPKSQQFFMHNTYKFRPDKFLDVALNAGFKRLATEISSDKKIAIHLLKCVGNVPGTK